MPKITVDPETYEVRADGELLTCEPAKVLPLAQTVSILLMPTSRQQQMPHRFISTELHSVKENPAAAKPFNGFRRAEQPLKRLTIIANKTRAEARC